MCYQQLAGRASGGACHPQRGSSTASATTGGTTSTGSETSTSGGTVASPSEGCGTANDPPATLNVADTFPPTYDGTTPIPLIFGYRGWPCFANAASFDFFMNIE